MVGDVGPDINLSIQYLLNCGSEVAGSCKGGSASGAYQFINQNGFIPYDSCQPYLACSKDSTQGFCQFIDTTCNPMNTCRTCTSPSKGGTCHSVSSMWNESIIHSFFKTHTVSPHLFFYRFQPFPMQRFLNMGYTTKMSTVS